MATRKLRSLSGEFWLSTIIWTPWKASADWSRDWATRCVALTMVWRRWRPLERFQPDIVLMDLGMPNLNGYDAARRMRNEPWGRELNLVATTGWGQEEDRRRTAEAGFDSHLVKPIEITALREVLESPAKRQSNDPWHIAIRKTAQRTPQALFEIKVGDAEIVGQEARPHRHRSVV